MDTENQWRWYLVPSSPGTAALAVCPEIHLRNWGLPIPTSLDGKTTAAPFGGPDLWWWPWSLSWRPRLVLCLHTPQCISEDLINTIQIPVFCSAAYRGTLTATDRDGVESVQMYPSCREQPMQSCSTVVRRSILSGDPEGGVLLPERTITASLAKVCYENRSTTMYPGIKLLGIREDLKIISSRPGEARLGDPGTIRGLQSSL